MLIVSVYGSAKLRFGGNRSTPTEKAVTQADMAVEIARTALQRTLVICCSLVQLLLGLKYHRQIEVGLPSAGVDRGRFAHPRFGLVEVAHSKARPAQVQKKRRATQPQCFCAKAAASRLVTATPREQRRGPRQE